MELNRMGLLTDLFTWWNGATIGTKVYTSLVGSFVGQDEFGNRYYRRRGGKFITWAGNASARK